MSKVKQKEVSDDTNQPKLSKFFGIEKIKTREVTDDCFKIIEETYKSSKDGDHVQPLSVPSEAEVKEYEEAKAKDKDIKKKMDSASVNELTLLSSELMQNALLVESLHEKALKSDLLKAVISARKDAQDSSNYWKSGTNLESTKKFIDFKFLVKQADELLTEYDDIQATKKRQRAEALAEAKSPSKRQRVGAVVVITPDTDTATASTNEEEEDTATISEVIIDGKSVPINEIMPEAEKHKGSRVAKKPTKQTRTKTEKEYISKKAFDEEMAKCAKYAKSPNQKRKERYSNVKPAHWDLTDGEIYCLLCGCPQAALRQIVQHANNDNHLKLAKQKEENDAKDAAKKRVTLQPRLKTGNENETRFIPPSPETEYRKEVIRMAAELGIPLATAAKLEQTSFWKKYGSQKHKTGGVTNLGRGFIPIVHKEDIKVVKELFSTKKGNRTTVVYANYGVIYDGTPSFAEAEAIMIRFVTCDGEIVDLLVRVALFKNHLKGKQLARHIYDCVTKRLGLELKEWRTAMCDRANTNKSGLNLLRKLDDCFVRDFYCCSHTLNNTGKAMFNSDYAKFILSFRIAYNKIIKHKGKARRVISKRMGTTVKRGGGVRFFGDFEQITQIVDFGLQNIITHICPELQEKNASVASTVKLLEEFGGNEKKGELGMAILEGSAIADIARAWCQACYSLEGNDPLIYVAHEVFKRIEESMNDDSELDRVTRNLPLVIALVREAFDFVEQNEADANEALEKAKKAKKDKEEAVKKLVAEKAAIVNPTSSSGRQVSRTDRSLSTQDFDRVADLSTKIAEAKADVKNAEKNRSKCWSVLKAAKKSFKDWKEKFPHETGEEGSPSLEEQLRAHVSKIKRPGKEYYEKQFLEPTGDLYDLRKAAEAAATVLNPLWLKEQRLDDLQESMEKADLLKHFGFPEFNRNFIENFKEEIPDMILRAQLPYDWNGIEPSPQYATRLVRRAKRKKIDVTNTVEVNGGNEEVLDSDEEYDSSDDSLFGEMEADNDDSDDGDNDYDGEDDDNDESVQGVDDDNDEREGDGVDDDNDEREGDGSSWLNDPGEKARRIWHYWKPIVSSKAATDKDDYRHYRKALRLVALVQVSSCAVERVFSQLQEIRRKCKDGMLEDILEVRLFEQCNGSVPLSILANQANTT